MAINFHTQDIQFNLENRKEIKNWIKKVANFNNKDVGDINYIFVSDQKILEINNEYLSHNYFTDIITFDYSKENIISGDLYISIDTIKENSKEFNSTFIDELHRVMIHGVLHLIGFNDKSESEQELMREKEDLSLSMLNIA